MLLEYIKRKPDNDIFIECKSVLGIIKNTNRYPTAINNEVCKFIKTGIEQMFDSAHVVENAKKGFIYGKIFDYEISGYGKEFILDDGEKTKSVPKDTLESFFKQIEYTLSLAATSAGVY